MEQVLRLRKLFDELIKEYEKSEMYSILFYSTDKARDFLLLEKRVKRYSDKLDEIINGKDIAVVDEMLLKKLE